MDNIKNKKVWRAVVGVVLILGVIIIPLFYSYFYLHAFWDPYNNLSKLPVAVVNLDQGAAINGAQTNLGDELVAQLHNDTTLDWVFTDQQTAETGVTTGDKYYAMITVPADFSQNIASAQTSNKQTGILEYSANEKRNYLASQILNRAVVVLEEEMRSEVDSQITQDLTLQLQQVPASLKDLNDGLKQLDIGSASLQSGIAQTADGQNSLLSGAQTLDSGLATLLSGANSLSANLTALNAGAQQTLGGANQLSSSTGQYVAGVDSLIAQNQQLMATLQNLYNTTTDASTKATLGQLLQSAADGSAQLSALSASGDSLISGAGQVAAGVSSLAQGASQLQSGATQLQSGISSAKDGSAQLVTGATSLAAGSAQLQSGADSLNAGIQSAEDSVGTSLASANAQLPALNGLAEYAAAPVKVVSTPINPVPNYGTAFAPYFMSLSLWVGALIIFMGIYLDIDRKIPWLARGSRSRLARAGAFAAIGLIQAVALALVVRYGLHLTLANQWAFYLACILVSMAFLSIVQFLFIHLKDVGKFLAMLLLILQLTSCGGTFPMELLPSFFGKLYPYMPMTYSVNLFKEAISGFNSGKAWRDAGILFGFMALFVAATLILSALKKRPEVTDTAA